jgi:NADH-quinone oxidoreductase subunit I
VIGMLKGLATTLSTFTRKPVTIQYPDEKHPLPVRQRSFPVLVWDFDHDEPACTGCNVCVRNCPVDCMTATMMDNPKYAEGLSDRRKIVEKFWIDYARCMRCNICVEVCPFEAIVMDNNWTGHERAVFDRRDLHMDLDDLTWASRNGLLTAPFRPQDSIAYLEAVEKGEEPPPISFKFARPEARQAQLERIAKGEGPAIRLRPPEKPKVAAVARAGAGAAEAEEEALSPKKARAKRMKLEREAKEYEARGEPVPAELLAQIARYRAIEEGKPVPAAAGGVGAAAAGEEGALSPKKARAKRMKLEREAKEYEARGEPVPPELLAQIAEYRAIEEGKPVPAAVGAPAAAPAGGAQPKPAAAAGVVGDPNSPRKQRARRMRAERAAREALARGEPVPPEVKAVLDEFGISIESLQP